MKILDSPIEGLYIIEPNVFEDSRGYFFESFNDKQLREIGIQTCFVQDNQSLSQKGALRGLHFQTPPFAQCKLVRVIKGEALDVVVDIRKKSKTYGQSYAIKLNETNKLMLWIPEGFAHGFQSIEDDTIFFYKCTQYYNKASEGCILWNDNILNIQWENIEPLISEKDKEGIKFNTFNSMF